MRLHFLSAASLPTLAKNARMGHPQLCYCRENQEEGWATRPLGEVKKKTPSESPLAKSAKKDGPPAQK